MSELLCDYCNQLYECEYDCACPECVNQREAARDREFDERVAMDCI